MNIIANSKNFKILELSSYKLISTGGLSICDCCNTFMAKGYFVAVLNMTYCEEHYNLWLKEAINYPEDQKFEDYTFQRMKNFIINRAIEAKLN